MTDLIHPLRPHDGLGATLAIESAGVCVGVGESATGRIGIWEWLFPATQLVDRPEDPCRAENSLSKGADEADLASIRQIQQGDGRGLDVLMERHAEALHRFIFRYTNNAEDAADISQETFIRVFKKAKNYTSKASVKTWIYSIALNLCRDRGRRNQRVKWIPFIWKENEESRGVVMESMESVQEEVASDHLKLQELERAIATEVAGLPKGLKEAFTLYVLEELTQKEVASILKLSVKSVESKVYRARRQLKKSLAPLLDDCEEVD